MIQFAKPEDVPQVVTLAYNSFEENGLKAFYCEPDFDKILAYVTQAVLDQVVLVRRNEANPKLIDGVCGFRVSTPWLSNDPVMLPFMFFIKKDKRSFKLAKEFVSAAKEYAIMNRLPIVFDLFAQKDVEKKKKLLKYLGFREHGSFLTFNYVKE